MIEIKTLEGFLNKVEQKIVKIGLEEHSVKQEAPVYKKDRKNWLVYENDILVGTLTADILWDWIYIDELWVDDSQRGKGLGKQLMNRVEEYAISNNLSGLWLWTQSWQAASFYKKLGFKEFTQFNDFPKGHQRIGLRKEVL